MIHSVTFSRSLGQTKIGRRVIKVVLFQVSGKGRARTVYKGLYIGQMKQ